MISEEFTVNNYYELLAIHKVMMEARFSTEPNDLEVAGSPIAAALHERVIDKLISLDVQNNGEDAKAQWDEWLLLDKGAREWNVAFKRALSDSRWDTWEEIEQRFFAMTLLSPFDVSEALLAEFVSSVHITRAKMRKDDDGSTIDAEAAE